MMTIYVLKRAMKNAGYNRFTLRFNALTGNEIRVSENLKVNGKPAFWSVIERLGISGGGGNSTFHQIKPYGIAPEDLCEHDLTKLVLRGMIEDSDDYKNYWETSSLRSLKQ
ncbi:MAG: hypothetical protein AMXMBFR16_11260 [Candidatus Uhrbacteria bacterium]